MSYIEDSLVPGETIVYSAQPSLAQLIWPGISVIILAMIANQIHPLAVFVVIVAGLMVAVQILTEFWTTEFALTNRRIIAKRGFIRRHSLEILLTKVESVSISQSIGGRIFNFGTVSVVGSGGTKEYFRGISNPMELRKFVNSQISTVS